MMDTMIHLNNNMAISFIRHRIHIILLQFEYRFVGKQIKDGSWAYKIAVLCTAGSKTMLKTKTFQSRSKTNY